MKVLAFEQAKSQLEFVVVTKGMSGYYIAIASSVLLTGVTVVNPYGILFIGSLLALTGLVIDFLLALYGNYIINSFAAKSFVGNYLINGKRIFWKWVFIFYARQVVSMVGFLSLVTGMVFGL